MRPGHAPTILCSCTGECVTVCLKPDSVTRCEHSAPTTIARPIRAGLGDVHDTLSRCVAECAQKVVAVRGDDDHFPRRS